MMVDAFKSKLYDWYKKNDLIGFYLIGSRSINEDNAFSDIDFWGLTKDKLSYDNISLLRNELREKLNTILPSQKIGFRIRAIQELPSFQIKLKSWGYDLLCSHHIFGKKLNTVLPQTNTIGFDKCLVFNNMIELLWYNQLCLNTPSNNLVKNYYCAKSIMNIINFILYNNEIFIPTIKGRVSYIENNKNLINKMSISIKDVHNTFQVICSPESNHSQIDFDRLRHNFIKETYLNLQPSFEKNMSEFSNHDYWNYDSPLFNPLNLIYKKLKKSNTYTDLNFPYYYWRMLLIDSLIELDAIRLNNPDSLLSATKNFINLLVKKEIINVYNSTNESILNLLLKLERIRLEISETKKDSSRIID